MTTSIKTALIALSLVPAAALAARKPIEAYTIAVSPTGSDAADGTPAHPFQTLQRAQQAVREHNTTGNVVVQLADGTWRLTAPLRFASADGGQPGGPTGHYTVTWAAAPNVHPVLSGAVRVTHWTLSDPAKHIWSAETTKGQDTRQLWVNDHLAPMAQLELKRADYTFTRAGLTPKPSAPTFPELANDTRLELRATGFFTERVAPVERLTAKEITMRQPAWDNNLWGYDTIEKPYHPESAHLILANSPRLIRSPGQWAIAPAEGKLYLRPEGDADPNTLDVELPVVEVLVSIAGSLDKPIENLHFEGIRFSHTTWLGPSGPEGYASQQSGSFLTGHAAAFPADPIATCDEGCPAFETVRNEWTQIPASIQVSAANLISFTSCVFAHLGQYALGIGNDAPNLLAKVGLATSDITVTRSVFTDDAGGAVLAGGVRRDAHHPGYPGLDARLINRQLAVTNNRIQSVARDYRDHSAILSTYDEGALILHNDIADVPYDAIDVGYGWGMHDAGGNPNYRVRMHGYDAPQNLVYRTPTTHHDVVVASNRVHGAKHFFHDGGAIYNLSASPNTLITENYIFDNSAQIGLYLDEGSRFITVRRNVVQDPGSEWLNVNTAHSALPLRISTDNIATGNWHDGTKIGGLWTNYENNLILDDHLIPPNTPVNQWPAEAQSVMRNAGIEPSAGSVAYGDAIPDPNVLAPAPPTPVSSQ